jgi:hypothetical protein
LTTSDQKIKLTNNTKHIINMKKLLTILALASAATFVHAQGTVIFNSSSALYAISTNGAAIPGGGTIGKTAITANGFDYALLMSIANYGGPAPSSDPLNSAWSGAVLTGVNFGAIAGGLAGQGGGGGAPVAGWGVPGATYTDGTEKYYMIVGWSSNLGTTWGQVSGNLASNWASPWVGNAFFGTSAIGFGYAGGGSFSLPAPSLFGVTGAMPGGLTSGFQLMYVPVPEPSTIALAGLAGLSLLLFRRRK